MAELAGRAHVPIVFASPVANERDQPPIEDLGRATDPQAKWVTNLRTGERELQWGDKAKAIELLEAAKAEHPHDPLTEFRLGQALEKVGHNEEAATQYQLALELDGCRFRAPSVFRSTMDAAARQHAETGAHYIDLYSALANSPEMPVPGRKCFLEHVHFTWDGNRAVARTIAKGLWRDVLKRGGSTNDSDQSNRLVAEPEDHMAAFVLAMMIYQKAPFRDGADAQKLAKELAEDSSFAFSRLTPERQAVFEQVSPADMAGDLMSALVRSSRPISSEETGRWLRLRHQRRPWVASHRTELVEWLRSHGHDDEADQVTKSADDWP
jgi:tetratricopeptide (TPR) repeat protein